MPSTLPKRIRLQWRLQGLLTSIQIRVWDMKLLVEIRKAGSQNNPNGLKIGADGILYWKVSSIVHVLINWLAGEVSGSWRTWMLTMHYFRIPGDKLFFAKSQHSAPHGMIDLSHCQTVKSAEFKAGQSPLILQSQQIWWLEFNWHPLTFVLSILSCRKEVCHWGFDERYNLFHVWRQWKR